MEFPELDRLKEEKEKSYGRFERHGEEFIDVFDDGIPEIESKWASAEEIYEASDVEREPFTEETGNRTFVTIYNLLCEADLLEAFHDSPQYEIDTDNYDKKTLIHAWEHVSGKTYGEEDDGEPEKDILEADELYESLKE